MLTLSICIRSLACRKQTTDQASGSKASCCFLGSLPPFSPCCLPQPCPMQAAASEPGVHVAESWAGGGELTWRRHRQSRGPVETAEGTAALPAPHSQTWWSPHQISSHLPARNCTSAPRATGSLQKDRSDHLKTKVRQMDLEAGVKGLGPVNTPSFVHSFNKCLLITRPCTSIQDRTEPWLLLVGTQMPG